VLSLQNPSDEMAKAKFTCRQCRKILFTYPEVDVQDSHGSPALDETTEPPCQTDLWFVPEECMPAWVSEILEESGWEKGKLKCPSENCNARVGSYNFVSGNKCKCKKNCVPPIHIVKSKVDFMPVALPVQFPVAPTLPSDSVAA